MKLLLAGILTSFVAAQQPGVYLRQQPAAVRLASPGLHGAAGTRVSALPRASVQVAQGAARGASAIGGASLRATGGSAHPASHGQGDGVSMDNVGRSSLHSAARGAGAAVGAARGGSPHAASDGKGDGISMDNVGKGAVHGAATEETSPYDHWREMKFKLSQARHDAEHDEVLKHAFNRNTAAQTKLLEFPTPAEKYMFGMQTKAGFDVEHNMRDIALSTMLKLEEAIAHHLDETNGNPDERTMWEMERKLDSLEYEAERRRWKALWPMLPEGDKMANFFGRQRRLVDIDIAERNYHDAHKKFDDKDPTMPKPLFDEVQRKLRNAHREMDGSNLRLLGTDRAVYWFPHIEARASDVNALRKVRRRKKKMRNLNPNEDTERELYLAELSLEAAEERLLASKFEQLGQTALSAIHWENWADIDDEYNDIVLQHLEEDYFAELAAGNFGGYGGAYADGGFMYDTWDGGHGFRTIGLGGYYGGYYDDYYGN